MPFDLTDGGVVQLDEARHFSVLLRVNEKYGPTEQTWACGGDQKLHIYAVKRTLTRSPCSEVRDSLYVNVKCLQSEALSKMKNEHYLTYGILYLHPIKSQWSSIDFNRCWQRILLNFSQGLLNRAKFSRECSDGYYVNGFSAFYTTLSHLEVVR